MWDDQQGTTVTLLTAFLHVAMSIREWKEHLCVDCDGGARCHAQDDDLVLADIGTLRNARNVRALQAGQPCQDARVGLRAVSSPSLFPADCIAHNAVSTNDMAPALGSRECKRRNLFNQHPVLNPSVQLCSRAKTCDHLGQTITSRGNVCYILSHPQGDQLTLRLCQTRESGGPTLTGIIA